MSKERTAVGPWLFGPLLFISTLGYGLLNMPHYGAASLGPSGYLAELFAFFIVLPGLAAIYLLARRFPGRSLIEQSELVLGSALGRVAGAAYLAAVLLMLAMFTRDTVNLVGAYYLNRTPVWFIALSLLTVAAFLASRGLETVARLATFLFLPALLVMLCLFLFGFQNFNVSRVLPVETNLPRLVRGGFSVAYIYYALGASALALPMFQPRRSILRTAGWVLPGTAVFFSAYAFGAIGVLGHDYVLRWAWPSMMFVHTIEYPYLLLEHAGLLMVIDWVAIILAGTGFLYYLIGLGAAQLSGAMDYKRWIYLLFPVKFALIVMPKNYTQTKLAFQFVARYGWIAFFAFPILLLALALLRGRKEADADAA